MQDGKIKSLYRNPWVQSAFWEWDSLGKALWSSGIWAELLKAIFHVAFHSTNICESPLWAVSWVSQRLGCQLEGVKIGPRPAFHFGLYLYFVLYDIEIFIWLLDRGTDIGFLATTKTETMKREIELIYLSITLEFT